MDIGHRISISSSANLRNHLFQQRPFLRGILNRVRSTIDVSELRSITLTHAVTNLNAYKGKMFIRVILPTIVLIVHIIID
jgi:hypothetical protein